MDIQQGLRALAQVSAAVIALVLLLAAAAKLSNRQQFESTLRSLVKAARPGDFALRALAWCVIVAECAIGVALLSGFAVAAIAAVALMAIFLAVAIYAVAYKIKVSCSCFGANGKFTGKTIARNGMLMFVSLIAASQPGLRLTAVDVIFAVILILLVLSVSLLVGNSSEIRGLKAIRAV